MVDSVETIGQTCFHQLLHK